MLAGRFFTDSESQHRIPVAVIGEDLYRALFGLENAIGKEIEVDGHEVEVIGVMKRPAASIPGQDDNRVVLPYFTMRKMFPTANENVLMVQAKDGQLAAAIDELSVVLRQERHVPLTRARQFRRLDRRSDGGGFPRAHLRHRAGHGGAQLHRPAGREASA